MIRVINIHQSGRRSMKIPRIDIRRPGPLGNPFHVTRTRRAAEACALYEPWLDGELKRPDSQLSLLVARLSDLADKRDIELGCSCKQAPCHGEILKRRILLHGL